MKTPLVNILLSPTELHSSRPSTLEVWGNPQPTPDGLEFNGVGDGLLLSESILPGAGEFTIEARLQPRSDGNFEQRFFHIQDTGSTDRILLELRLLPDGLWYADTYFQSQGQYIILQTKAVLSPADCWSTYRVVYDGRFLSNWINGRLVESLPFVGGTLPTSSQTSIGIRANKTHPFRGTLGPLFLWPSARSPEFETPQSYE